VALKPVHQRRVVCALLWISLLGTARAAEPQEFPLPPYDDAIYIPVEVGGKERLFLLDSGASAVIVHDSLRDHLGKSEGAHGVKGAEGHRLKVETFAAPAMRIGTLDWTCPDDVGCFDFSLFQAASGREIEGILGMPFFAASIIQLDFDRRRVRILPADTPPEADWGTAVSLQFSKGGVPKIPLQLPGVGPELCTVDTGYVNRGFNGTLSLNWAICLKLENNGDFISQGERTVGTMSGVHTIRYGTVSKVTMQNLEHTGLPTDCSKGESRIGLGYLKRFRVTFDAGNKVAYFAKGEEFEGHVQPSLGFGGLRVRGKTVIGAVDEGSPAETSGLRGGDELILVDGNSPNQMPLAEVRWVIRELSEKGTKPVPLTIRREGKVCDLQLDLSSIYQ